LKPRVVVSLEQALSLPYATWRFAHLGWRVIRIEATPTGRADPGDPNRYIGRQVAEPDRRSYFLGQNVGKESLVLNLKEASGRAILHRLIRSLKADIFCCNTLPARYRDLGIDYDTLRQINPQIIWAGISAMGPQYPSVPGYDPVVQAMSGFMELTGDPAGPPMLTGIPVTDLKAGDEVYAGVLAALVDHAETGIGARIDVSMLQAAASWLITTLPLLNFSHGSDEVSRCGNQHRKFIPTDVFKTSDGQTRFHLSRFDGIHAMALDGEFLPDGTLKGVEGGIVATSSFTSECGKHVASAADPNSISGRRPPLSTMPSATNVKARFTEPVHAISFSTLEMSYPAARKISSA